MRVKTSVCCSSKSDLCKCLYRNVSDFAVHACTCVCVLKCPCGRARNTAGGKIWHWSLACSLRGSAATHTHTHDPETHFDLHHLVWSARPRAWQLMINISPRPLPSQLRVHANAHVQNEIHLLFLVHVLYTCSLCVTHTPSLPSQAVSVVGQLAGSLNWCFWHCAVTARAPLYPPHPSVFPYQSLSCSPCHFLITSWDCHLPHPLLTTGQKVESSHLGGFPWQERNLCAAFRIFDWSVAEEIAKMLHKGEKKSWLWLLACGAWI